MVSFISIIWKASNFPQNKLLQIRNIFYMFCVLSPNKSENRIFLAHPHPLFLFCSLQRSDLCSANRPCQLLSPAGYILKRKRLQRTVHLPHAAYKHTEGRLKELETHLLWPLSSHTNHTISRTKHHKTPNPSLTSWGCQCVSITAQHLILPFSQPYPLLGPHLVSCLKVFPKGNMFLIMCS